jgi:diguanylate cyclase (GGDEF)-like protein/PAS domain S-box-containing protein
VGHRHLLSSLQVRITLAVVVLVLVCVWGFALLVAGRQEVRLRELLAAQQRTVIGYLAEDIDSMIRLRIEGLTQTANSIPVDQLGDRQVMTRLLASRVVLQQLFNSGVIVAHPDGIGAFADYPPLPGRTEVDFRGLDSFQSAWFDERTAMGQPFRGRFRDKPVITFAAPIFDGTGKIAAMLIGISTLDAPNFLELIGKRLPEGGGDILVMAPALGIFVAGTDPGYMLRALPIDKTNQEFFDRIRAEFEGSLVSDKLDGVEKLISVKRIPAAGWSVVASLPTEQAFAPVREQRRYVLAGAAVLSLLIGLFATILLRRALGPLGRAADRLDAITQGAAPLAALPEGRPDEVGRLMRSFNRLQERLAHESAALRLAGSVFDNTIEGVLISDAEGSIIDVNRAFSEITGYQRSEVLGKNPRILKSGRQGPEFYEAMWHALKSRGHWRGEVWNRRKDGDIYPELLTISAVRDEGGTTTHFVAVFSDITQIKQQQRQLESIAHFDALTGLPNRLLLADRMQQAIARTQRTDHLLAVCYLDLDNFKPVNDTLGHDAGDQLLVEIAARLKTCVRGDDTVARLGGDEFVLLLTELERIHECEAVIERVLQSIAVPCVVAGKSVSISASIGLTFYPMDDADPDTLLRHADQAMYKSKQTGRHCYHLFDAEQDRRARIHHETLARIEEGLRRGEFVLHYQPQVDLRRGCIVGVEALIRWQHPERGLLPPGEFLPDIEHHDLIVTLGEWVIEAALAQLGEWRRTGLDVMVSVNIAARHLQREDFVPRLRDILAAHPETPASGHLELEVVESTALEDMSRVPRIIEDCRALGVGFAIDDFGIGYSSLTYFKKLPVDTLKIDQSFIRDMLKDPDDLAIVEGVIGLSEVFRRNVIAEGVETVAHGIALLGLGCELAQGYGIARPMPAADFAAWAKQWQSDPAWAAVSRSRWPREDIQLLVAENNHRSWVDAIAARLAGIPADEAPELDPHACQFGQWYDTTGRTRHGELVEFRAIDAVHRRIHELGAAALTLQGQDRNEEACTLLPELFRLRDELVAHLRTLQSSVGDPRPD